MIRFFARLSALLVSLIVTGPGFASSSGWFETEGGRVRLVTTGLPDASGKLRGVLEINLDPGWKTYWRDPGDAGVPPTIDVKASTNVKEAALDFPAPQRHDEGGFKWAGYDYPVALPVTFSVPSPGDPVVIDANIFLGLCKTVCIPLQATLSLDPAGDPDNAGDGGVVSAAWAALPEPARPDFGVKVVSAPGDTNVIVQAVFPGDPASAELFVAGDEHYSFTTPVRAERDGKTYFSMTVSQPAAMGFGPGLHYTLSTDAGSVSGFLPYF